MRFSWTDKKSGKLKTFLFDVVTKESIESVLNLSRHPVEEGEDIIDNAHQTPQKITIEGYVSNKPLPSNPGVFQDDVVEETMSLMPTSVPLDTGNANDVPRLLNKTVQLDYSNQGKADTNFPVTPGALTKMITGAISSLFGKPPEPPKTMQGYNALATPGAPTYSALVFKGIDGFENRARDRFTTLLEAQDARARVTVTIMLTQLDDMIITKISAPRSKEDGSGCTFNVDLEHVRIVQAETVNAPVAAESRGAVQIEKGAKAAAEDEKADKKRNKTNLQHLFKLGAGFKGDITGILK